MPDPRLKTYAPQAVRHLAAAGHVLAARQETAAGAARATSRPGRASDDVDFHGTLSAIWIWARHQRLSGANALSAARAAPAWAFVEANAQALHPRRASTAPPATRRRTTARWCCRAAAAERGAGRRATASGRRSPTARRACSPIHLGALEILAGASSAIPGFLALRARSSTRAPSRTGACWPAGASSSSARSA